MVILKIIFSEKTIVCLADDHRDNYKLLFRRLVETRMYRYGAMIT